MSPSIAPEQPEFTPSALITLEECSEASVYAPGYIQPHGVLVALQEPHLTILQVSENVAQFFGISAVALLGQSLQRLFSRSQVKHFANILQQDNLDCCNPFELKIGRKKAQTFRGTLHRTPEALILELEPQPASARSHSTPFYHRLQAAILSLRSTTRLADLAQVLAREVKSITGFDRVMVYRFATDDHGMVIAEEKEGHLVSYLGLHYPAIDIPVPARKLFLRNWVRQIPDVNYQPVPLISLGDAPVDQPLDLSDCVLRGVSPYHIEYLQNMGVAGSLTISLIDNQNETQRLWGLIACHHSSPKSADYETRKTCEFLGQFASIELAHQQEQELSRYRTQVKTLQTKLQQEFLHDPNFMQQVLIRHAAQLLDLVHAEGVAIVLDQQITLIGQTPTLPEVQALLTSLLPLHQQDLYLTDCLARAYLSAKAFKDSASGILAIAIALHQKSYHLLWFRPEQIQTVNWAGDPRTAVRVDADGDPRLTPRKSFELWQETVRETSLPWQSAEVEAALMMRNTLMMAVLEFSQAALEQAAEQAAIASRAKSQFLAKMSHELRTPLNAILGFTQVMHHSSNTPSEFQEHLGIISRSGEHLLALINDVLEMSRIEAGQLVLTDRCFSLHQLLQLLQEMFTLKASQKGLTLSFETEPSLPRYVCGDAAKLRQILINLISNAIKFTTQGSVTVQVSSTAASLPQQSGASYPDLPPPGSDLPLCFKVKDTGCGIDCRHWESIFEAFMQTEQGRQAQGSGLGLSISQQFARLMGGDITVHSIINQGSTFTCNVLLHEPESIDLVEPEMAPLVIGLQPGQPTYRILVVEDVLENRQLLQTLLEPVGFEVYMAKNGVEAIAQWQQWHPHLIFMDIQMPVMDGYQATQQIRYLETGGTKAQSLSPQLPPSTVRIIALTAYAFAKDRAASLLAGCDDYISKPFTETLLFEMIARHLGVRYRYADRTLAPVANSAPPPLRREVLNIMPPEWITQVHSAALALNDEKLQQLIAQIPPEGQRLTEAMNFWVDNFQLEAIVKLIEPQAED